MCEIFVIDFETTGLKKYPIDLPVEVGIVKLDLESGIITDIYDKTIKYPRRTIEPLSDCWIFNKILNPMASMTPDDCIDETLKSKDEYLTTVIQDLKGILNGKNVCAYNNGFDVLRFLYPMGVCEFNVMPDPMILSRHYGSWNSWNGYARLESIYNKFYNDMPKEAHRGCSDARQCAKVILREYQDGIYPVDAPRSDLWYYLGE